MRAIIYLESNKVNMFYVKYKMWFMFSELEFTEENKFQLMIILKDYEYH